MKDFLFLVFVFVSIVAGTTGSANGTYTMYQDYYPCHTPQDKEQALELISNDITIRCLSYKILTVWTINCHDGEVQYIVRHKCLERKQK